MTHSKKPSNARADEVAEIPHRKALLAVGADREQLRTMAEDAGQPVVLHIYDLSSGLAAQLSKALLGKQVRPSPS